MSDNARGFSIRFLLPDGTPDGMKIVEKSYWVCRAIVGLRGAFQDLKQRPDFRKTGVHVLFGQASPDDLPTVYIGEGDPVGDRLTQHEKTRSLDHRRILHQQGRQPQQGARAVPGSEADSTCGRSQAVQAGRRRCCARCRTRAGENSLNATIRRVRAYASSCRGNKLRVNGATGTLNELLQRDADDPAKLVQFEQIQSTDAVLDLAQDGLFQPESVGQFLLAESSLFADGAQQSKESLLLSAAAA